VLARHSVGGQTGDVGMTGSQYREDSRPHGGFRIRDSSALPRSRSEAFCSRHRRQLVNRYYDPATEQFISVDPLVGQTGQAFSFAGDDPVNGSDPLGLFPGQGLLDSARHAVASGYNDVNNFLSNESQTLDCDAIGGGKSIFNGILGCAGDPNGPSCSTSGGAAGALKSSSSEADARAALADEGINVPSDYWAARARNGKGWVFRPNGSTNDDNAIETQEAGSSPKSPNGSFRIYNSKGVPTDEFGQQLGDAGVGQPETHFQFPPDPIP